MENDHIRQMGSVSTAEGPRVTVSGVSTSLSGSHQSFFDKRFSQEPPSARRNFCPSSEGGNRRSEASSRSRFLFSSFPGSEKEWKNETGNRSISSEQTSCHSSFQNGDKPIYQESHTSGYVDNFSRLDGCLLSYSDSSSVSEIPSICLEKQSSFVQGNAVRSLSSSSSFYPGFSGCDFSSSQPIYSDPFLFGRLSVEKQFGFTSVIPDSTNYQVDSRLGFPYFLEEIRDSSQSELHFSGRTLQDGSRENLSSRGEDSFSESISQQFSVPFSCPSSAISTTDRIFDLFDGFGSSRAVTHSPYSVLSPGILAPGQSSLGFSCSSFSETTSSSSLVVGKRSFTQGNSSSVTSSIHDSVHGFFHDRLGRYSRGISSLGSVESLSERSPHQCTGNDGSSTFLEALSRNDSRTDSSYCHRQHYSLSLSSESRGSSFSLPLSVSKGNSASMRQASDSGFLSSCSGGSEYSGRRSLSQLHSGQHRVGASSVDLSGDCIEVGSSFDRSFCHQSECQTGNLCVSCSRSQSLGGGCSEHFLEGNVQLHLSSFPPSESNSGKNSSGILQDHSYSSGLAETVLVSRTSTSVMCETSSPSIESRSSISVQRKKVFSKPGTSSSARLVAVRRSISQKGFSQGATDRISRSVRPSTGLVYDSKWSIFSAWCFSKQIDPLRVSVQQLADFFLFLFEEKGYTPATIKGYRSAISRTIHLSGGPDFGHNEHLSLLIKNFSIERPRQRRLIPSWDLSLVLKSLLSLPYVPLNSIDLKWLTYKCCFLLALATGRRRSEIHALSISDACFRFAADKSSVTLLTDPAFLAKNQLSDKGSGLITIPALPVEHSRTLCPVHVLDIYLKRTASLRSENCTRLFVPFLKGQKDISAKTISNWICSTVLLAYKKAGIPLGKGQVKAHEVRAIASSLSIFNSSTLADVLSAGFWRSENSFFYHYLRSMQQHSDNLYSLGPIISAQKVVLPPVSSQ